MAKTKQELRKRRHWRVRSTIQGTGERPRMSVCFSGRNIHVQFIDDIKGVTIAAVSTLEEAFKKKDGKNKSNVQMAVQIGKVAAERAISHKTQSQKDDTDDATRGASPPKGSKASHSLPMEGSKRHIAALGSCCSAVGGRSLLSAPWF